MVFDGPPDIQQMPLDTSGKLSTKQYVSSKNTSAIKLVGSNMNSGVVFTAHDFYIFR